MSIKAKKFNESVHFAEQPAEADIKEWAESGFRTVVNLRPTEEVERGLSPSEEESLCRNLGIHYLHLPTKLEDLNRPHLQSCRQSLRGAPAPMVIHCAGGARAAALAAVIHAWEEGVSAEQVVSLVEQSGQSFNQQLRGLVLELAHAVR